MIGFRSRTWWKMAVAAAGYSVLAVMLVGGLGNLGRATERGLAISAPLLAAVILLALLIGGNAFGLKHRMPGFNAASRTRFWGSWAVLGVAGLFALATYPTYAPTPDELARRALVVATPTAQALPVAAEVVQPTPTTPAPPTATPPPPTATPRPTTPPKPRVSPEVQAYGAYMQPRLKQISESLSLLGEQSTQAGRTPTVILDQTWRVRTAVALGFLKNAGQEIQNYEPVPADLKTLDDLMVAIGKDLVFVADEYAAGVDALDGNRLLRASTRMQELPPKLQRALAEMNRVASVN